MGFCYTITSTHSNYKSDNKFIWGLYSDYLSTILQLFVLHCVLLGLCASHDDDHYVKLAPMPSALPGGCKGINHPQNEEIQIPPPPSQMEREVTFFLPLYKKTLLQCSRKTTEVLF